MPRDIFRLAFSANMEAEGGDTGELMLYGEIVGDYGKWYKENFPNDQSASDFDKAVKELKTKGAKKLNMRINSPGGIVSEAVAMRGILTGAGFEQIDIRIEGMCASAATILATIPGAHVSITPGSEYMIHNPWTIAFGNANEMERVIDHLRQLENTSRGFYEQRTGQSEEQLKAWMDEEKWFSAEDAVSYGFADEVAKEGADNALPAMACVSSRAMEAMKSLYKAVPEDAIAVLDEQEDPEGNAVTQDDLIIQHAPRIPTGENTEPAESAGEPIISNAASVAGAATEINNEEDNRTMEIKELNVDQLRAENPALLEQIRQAAVNDERQRQEDIDAITLPTAECRAMAEEAKRNGTSVMDFQRQIVAAARQKGADWMTARQKETEPAKNITGSAPQDFNRKSEEDEIKSFAQEMKGLFGESKNDTMF